MLCYFPYLKWGRIFFPQIYNIIYSFWIYINIINIMFTVNYIYITTIKLRHYTFFLATRRKYNENNGIYIFFQGIQISFTIHCRN